MVNKNVLSIGVAISYWTRHLAIKYSVGVDVQMPWHHWMPKFESPGVVERWIGPFISGVSRPTFQAVTSVTQRPRYTTHLACDQTRQTWCLSFTVGSLKWKSMQVAGGYITNRRSFVPVHIPSVAYKSRKTIHILTYLLTYLTSDMLQSCSAGYWRLKAFHRCTNVSSRLYYELTGVDVSGHTSARVVWQCRLSPWPRKLSPWPQTPCTWPWPCKLSLTLEVVALTPSVITKQVKLQFRGLKS